MLHQLSVITNSREEFIDITGRVRDVVRAAGARSGICCVFVQHTTAAVTVNEHADPDVIRDMLMQLDKLAPESGRYAHAEGNSPAHIKTALLGNSVTLPVENGDLVLGTCQGIFFCEFDGPRNRQVLVKIIPDR